MGGTGTSPGKASGRKLLLDGLKFAEAPRWAAERLWFVDMIAHEVRSVDMAGRTVLDAQYDDETSGLGFLPDGSGLVVLRKRKQLIRFTGGASEVFCDLSGVPCESLNDMVVGPDGAIYVGAVVRRAAPGTDDIGEAIVVLDRQGQIRQVVRNLINPNGMAISADRRTLIVAETWLKRLTSFAILPDGRLGDRQTFADLAAPPDGICLDAEGAVWAALYDSGKFVRVKPGGEVTDEIDAYPSWAVACLLAGEDRRTLFLLSADTSPATIRTPGGTQSRIEVVDVNIPGAGYP